jgi:hypothetical protein
MGDIARLNVKQNCDKMSLMIGWQVAFLTRQSNYSIQPQDEKRKEIQKENQNDRQIFISH